MSHRLSTKIIGVLIGFFVVALTAIGMTLMVSTQLEGGAAAINDAGSQRMRSYRIGYLLALGVQDQASDGVRLLLLQEVAIFERVLEDLERGDPTRPLSAPKDAMALETIRQLKQAWFTRLKPLIETFSTASSPARRQELVMEYDHAVTGFVSVINSLVLGMERNFANNTNLLRSLQVLLAVLAAIGTLVLIRVFFVMVIKPVNQLHDGMLKMSHGELSARLPIASRDEFGVLAQGFNQMAGNLQAVYDNLEQHVEIKTRSLEEKNQELATLYEITTFLGEPNNINTLCEGFVARIRAAMGADAAAVRLHSTHDKELLLLCHEGLSEHFLAAENLLSCGECLCGEAVKLSIPIVAETGVPPPGMTLRNCVREGFRTVSAIAICHDRQSLGAFNLYFNESRPLSPQQVRLLETLGQHLGVALVNLRFRSREKELAISEERNLLAQELHDSIAQGLAFLNIQAQLLDASLKKQDLEDARRVTGSIRTGIQESYEDVRELLVHFRTRLNHNDLDTAILLALERFEQQTGITTSFDREGHSLPLPPEHEMQALHIVQEALANTRKHAQAKSLSVCISRTMDTLEIHIEDDGIGFDMERQADPFDRHVGIKIMRERAARIGGRCEIKSHRGVGTCVLLSLPLSRQPGGQP